MDNHKEGFWRIGEGFLVRFTRLKDGGLMTEWLPAMPSRVSPGLGRRYQVARQNYLRRHSVRSPHKLAV
jgi:hypothetical protein